MIDREKTWIKSMEWCAKHCKCHQMPERSFYFGDYQFPLCARCTGIAIGYVAGYIAAPFYTCKKWMALFMLPLIVDGSVQYTTKYESNNIKRVITGVLYGFAFTSLILKVVKKILKNLLK